MGTCTKRKLTLRKRRFFAIEKYVEDVKQGQKVDPDLVESIMRPTDLVKDELRRILFKMGEFRPKITKIRVCTFQMKDDGRTIKDDGRTIKQ